jgi:hypothetical protein
MWSEGGGDGEFDAKGKENDDDEIGGDGRMCTGRGCRWKHREEPNVEW